MSKNSMPLVTAYVTCYNQARYVVATLDSVRAQTYSNMELIVCDVCSIDGSQEIIRNWLAQNWPEAHFIEHKKNVGICKSINEIVTAARGKYLAGVAGDDLWIPEKTALQIDLLESLPQQVGLAYSDAYLMNEAGEEQAGYYIKTRVSNEIVSPLGLSGVTGSAPPPAAAVHAPVDLSACPHLDSCLMNKSADAFAVQRAGKLFNALLQINFIPAMTAMVRRRCYDKVGLYDEQLFAEDWDMWIRMSRGFSFAFLHTTTAYYRIHSASASHSVATRKAMNELMPAMFRKYAKKAWLRGTDREEYGNACLERYAIQLYRDSSSRRQWELLQLCLHYPHRENLFMFVSALLGLDYEQCVRLRKRLSRRKQHPHG